MSMRNIAALILGIALLAGPAAAQPKQPGFSTDGLYNLANSYARAGKPGLAVLNYERAALLSPGDPDIAANLNFVRTSAHVTAPSERRLARTLEAINPTVAAWLGALGITLGGLGVIGARLSRHFRPWAIIGAIFGVGLIGLVVAHGVALWPKLHAAVILVDQSPARVAPVPMGDTAFVLPEAETVQETAIHDEFMLVRTRDGRSGWVARANLATVLPSTP